MKEGKWLNEEGKVTLRYGHRESLKRILKDVQFVSATAYGNKEQQGLVLFYMESEEWSELPKNH